MKSPSRISQLVAADDNAELVLELLQRLCREIGLSTNRVVSPTAPPDISTTSEASTRQAVDKSGVPTTTSRDIEEQDDSGQL